MKPQTDRIPKSLIRVHGRPFAEWQLDWLYSEGVRDVLLCVGYRGDMIRDALGDGSRFGISITYVDEGDQLRGTGGALRLAFDSGVLAKAFLVLNGDSYLSVSLADLEDEWRRTRLPALMVLHHNAGRWDRSNAAFADGLVRYDKRRPDAAMEWIDYGIAILERDIVAKSIPREGASDLADVMTDLSARGLVAGFEAIDRFYEVGSPAGLLELEALLEGASEQKDATRSNASGTLSQPR